MDKFARLREASVTSIIRMESNNQPDVVYEDFDNVVSDRFTNAWESAGEPEIDSEYSAIYDLENPDEQSSIYEEMTINPTYDDTTPDPVKLIHDSSKRNSLTRCSELSLDLTPGTPPPLYRALMNKLTSSAAGDRKSKSLPRSMSPAGSPVLGRHRSVKMTKPDEEIPVRDQNVMNPLFTPSPVGSPTVQGILAQRLAQEEHNGDEEVYDELPSIMSDELPVLPPKKRSPRLGAQSPVLPPKMKSKSMSLKVRSSVSIERSKSADCYSPVTISKDRPKSLIIQRYSSVGTVKTSGPPLPPPPPPLPPTPPSSEVEDVEKDQFVGFLIGKSSKSGKLEKRLSRKVTKKQLLAEEAEKDKKLEDADDKVARCSSLALKDEWAEIDSMMQDLHCDISQTQENIRRPSGSTSLPDELMGRWLEKLQLQELQKLLELNGWDNTNFIKEIMCEDDMFVLGITNDQVRSKLLKSIEVELKEFQHSSIPAKVEDWLDDLQLSDYQTTFVTNNMDSMSRVLEIWEVELSTVLVIEPIGHRKRIMKSIRDLRTLQSSGGVEKETKKGGNKDKNPKWSTEDLVRGVDYAVRYYGCAKLEGKDNIKETAITCEKQQTKINKDQKVPEFRLRISSSGVDFIDIETQKSTCRYETGDISFVSRDKKNLLIFSFITTDRKLDLKLCHVFKTNTRTQAIEACSTIALSFQVAFKLREEAMIAAKNGD